MGSLQPLLAATAPVTSPRPLGVMGGRGTGCDSEVNLDSTLWLIGSLHLEKLFGFLKFISLLTKEAEKHRGWVCELWLRLRVYNPGSTVSSTYTDWLGPDLCIGASLHCLFSGDNNSSYFIGLLVVNIYKVLK